MANILSKVAEKPETRILHVPRPGPLARPLLGALLLMLFFLPASIFLAAVPAEPAGTTCQVRELESISVPQNESALVSVSESGDTLFAMQESKLFRFDSKIRVWSDVSPLLLKHEKLRAFASGKNTIAIAAVTEADFGPVENNNSRIFVSSDEGVTWKESFNQKDSLVSGLATNENGLILLSGIMRFQKLVVGIKNLLLLSEDDGKTWNPVEHPEPEKSNGAIRGGSNQIERVGLAEGSFLFAYSDGTLYRMERKSITKVVAVKVPGRSSNAFPSVRGYAVGVGMTSTQGFWSVSTANAMHGRSGLIAFYDEAGQLQESYEIGASAVLAAKAIGSDSILLLVRDYSVDKKEGLLTVELVKDGERTAIGTSQANVEIPIAINSGQKADQFFVSYSNGMIKRFGFRCEAKQ
ncbi:MAG: hypothetical protein R2684_10020 [Pyrinomonadaceae bacterium]